MTHVSVGVHHTASWVAPRRCHRLVYHRKATLSPHKKHGKGQTGHFPWHQPELIACTSSSAAPVSAAQSPRLQAWQVTSGICALAMLLCSMHRSAFTVLVQLIATDLSLNTTQVGVLQSAMLAGYLAGQIPGGKLADMFGGERVLLVSLLLWSVATAATGLSTLLRDAPTAMACLLAARVAFGLSSAAIMPSVSAMAAHWVPPHVKASTIAGIYAFFNVGGMLGLLLTPALAAQCQWPHAFLALGALGVAYAAAGGKLLPPRDAPSSPSPQQLVTDTPVGSLKGPVGRVNMHSELLTIDRTSTAPRAHLIGGQNSIATSSPPQELITSTPHSRVAHLAVLGGTERSLRQEPVLAAARLGGTTRLCDRDPPSTLQAQTAVPNNGRRSVLQGDSVYSSTLTSNGTSRNCATSGGSHGASHGSIAAVGLDGVGGGDGSATQVVAGGTNGVIDEVLRRSVGSDGSATQVLAGGTSSATEPLHSSSVTRRALLPLSRGETAAQLAVLCWSHAVIGTTFILQSWIPMYLRSLGVPNLGGAGALSSLTLLAAVVVGVGSGRCADGLIVRGMSRIAVRRTMHALSTLGCACAVLPLALAPTVTPLMATACLVANNALYAFSFAGFHAYVQDVAHDDAGVIVGMTNSCSILLGMVGTLATGWIVAVTGSYQAVFVATTVLYLSSFLAFCAVLQGRPLDLKRLTAQ